MIVQWTPDLSVGIEVIDQQHRRLFEIADELLGAMHAGKGRAEVVPVFDFLGEYVAQHLSLEEEAMLEVGDRHYDAHRAEHEEFRRAFAALGESLRLTGPSTRLLLEVNELLCGWLRTHIAKVDPSIRKAVEAYGGAVDAFSRARPQ